MDEYTDDSWWHSLKDIPIVRNYLWALIAGVIGFCAAGVYVTFFDAPREAKARAQLVSATTNEVTQQLGAPDRQFDAKTFNLKKNAAAADGRPLSNSDVTANGDVWLYKDSSFRYQTVFFNSSNRVERIVNTYWMDPP
jgi:hypothetical protein